MYKVVCPEQGFHHQCIYKGGTPLSGLTAMLPSLAPLQEVGLDNIIGKGGAWWNRKIQREGAACIVSYQNIMYTGSPWFTNVYGLDPVTEEPPSRAKLRAPVLQEPWLLSFHWIQWDGSSPPWCKCRKRRDHLQCLCSLDLTNILASPMTNVCLLINRWKIRRTTIYRQSSIKNKCMGPFHFVGVAVIVPDADPATEGGCCYCVVLPANHCSCLR